MSYGAGNRTSPRGIAAQQAQNSTIDISALALRANVLEGGPLRVTVNGRRSWVRIWGRPSKKSSAYVRSLLSGASTEPVRRCRPMKQTHLALPVALVLAALFITPARSQAPRWTRADGLLAAQACVHEASFSSLTDCGGIIQVVETRRAEGETFSAALRRTMPRFARGATDRAWTGELPYGPLTQNPAGWPFQVSARHYSSAWHNVVERVSAYMHELEPLPCSPEPSSWFGRRTDGNVLAEHLASGLWREAECGETVNAFLVRLDVD